MLKSWLMSPFQSAAEATSITANMACVARATLTASAGERATLAIVGRGANRSFGAPTAGLASSTLLQPFVDGSSVAVTTSFDVDRFGVTYPGPIAPDEPVALDWTRFGRADDPVLGAAMTWLRAQAACAGA